MCVILKGVPRLEESMFDLRLFVALGVRRTSSFSRLGSLRMTYFLPVCSGTRSAVNEAHLAMIKRLATHLLLRPEDIRPSHPDWEVIGVFNPGVARLGDETIILARVAERPRELRHGWTPHPYWSREKDYVVDWVENERLEASDPRVVRHLQSGLFRLTFVSHLRVARSRDGRTTSGSTRAIRSSRT